MDKRRAAVVALLTALLVAGTLLMAGGASAASLPCNDTPSQDTTVHNGGTTYAGFEVSRDPVGDGRYGLWVCFAATGGEPNQSWANVMVDTTPGSGAAPGATVDSVGCGIPAGAGGTPPYWYACTSVAGATGATVDPATTTNVPMAGASGTGGEIGSGPATCTYVNGGTPTCPLGGVTVLGVTVNEADLVPAVTPVTPAPPCTGVNNTCVPVGATVRLFNDTANPTVEVATGALGTSTPLDVAPNGTCVQVNATC